MRKPSPRVAFISLAAAIAVSAAATAVLESAAFPAPVDPKVGEAYEQGYEWAKARTEAWTASAARATPTPTPTPMPTAVPSGPPSKRAFAQSSTARELIITDVAIDRSAEWDDEVDVQAVCHTYAYASHPDFTGVLRAPYLDDWARGCRAAVTSWSKSGARTDGR